MIYARALNRATRGHAVFGAGDDHHGIGTDAISVTGSCPRCRRWLGAGCRPRRWGVLLTAVNWLRSPFRSRILKRPVQAPDRRGARLHHRHPPGSLVCQRRGGG